MDREPELGELGTLQRAAQWRLDFVAAENSMGFHAPQEMARILAEAIDLARTAEVKAVARREQERLPPIAASPGPAPAAPAPATTPVPTR